MLSGMGLFNRTGKTNSIAVQSVKANSTPAAEVIHDVLNQDSHITTNSWYSKYATSNHMSNQKPYRSVDEPKLNDSTGQDNSDFQSTNLQSKEGNHASGTATSFDSVDGLFFQQLSAFQFIGNNLGPQESATQKSEDRLLGLLSNYIERIRESSIESSVLQPIEHPVLSTVAQHRTCINSPHPLSQASPQGPSSSLFQVDMSKVSLIDSVDQEISSSSLSEHRVYCTGTNSDMLSSQSSTSTKPNLNKEKTAIELRTSPSSILRGRDGRQMWDDVFDIVFTRTHIGMKLAMDDSKTYAIVKECFDDSEAKQYAEIVSGILILAVNGEDVVGIGLSKTLRCLREAPRPVAVRFAKPSSSQSTQNQYSAGL